MQPTLDQDAVNLAKSIRQVESGGKFDASGKSGEHGAYQFMPDTWDAYSKEAGLNVPLKQATLEQQNEVAYKKIKQWKDKGYNPGQIASMWNAGPGKPNAYLEGNKGVNEKGVSYDTAAYAKQVAEMYQTIKKGSSTKTPTQAPAQNQPPNQNLIPPEEEKKTNALQKVLEFAFPILEKKERTPLQTAGDVGLSALWFVPGIGGAASAGLRGLGMGAKAARTLGAVGAGAATGYAADVSQGLSEGETTEALKPGFGTAAGAATGGLVSRFASKFSQEGVVGKIAGENNSVLGRNKKGALKLEESFSKDKDPGLLAAEKGINLKQLIDPEQVAYMTKDKAGEVGRDANALNEVLTDALKRTPGSKAVSELETEMLAKVPKNYPERANIVKNEMALLKQQYGETPSIADLNEWKQRNWNFSKFDMAVPSETRLTHRMIGNQLKTNVENLAKKGGLEGVGDMNEYIGSHMDLVNHLERIHGNKAPGGQLGNMLRTRGYEAAGAAVGGLFGGGLPGALLGMLAGNYTSKGITAVLRKIEASPIKSAILRRIVREDPEIVQKILQQSGKTPKELEALKKQLGDLGVDIFPEQTQRMVAPKLAPKSAQPGLMQNTLNTLGGRMGAQ